MPKQGTAIDIATLPLHKLTREEKAIIRDCAQQASGYSRVLMEPGKKCNINEKHVARYVSNEQRGLMWEVNEYLVSDDQDDIDLADQMDWKTLCKGFRMTEDGRASIDFYVSAPLDPMRMELQTNVTAYWEDFKLHRIHATCRGVMWRADGDRSKCGPDRSGWSIDD